MRDAVLLYITTGTHDEAVRIARILVEERLAASANISDRVRSIYRWAGKVQDAAESVLILKTAAARVPAVTARVKQLHSYECPCILAFAVNGGSADYLAWIAAETAPEQEGPMR